MTTAAVGAEPRRRLHPLSPLLHSVKTLALIIAAISWQGFSQLGPVRWIGVVVMFLVGAVALSVVSWLTTGYHVVGRELRVYEGLLWRRTRSIPLERVQAIDLVRPVLARLVGLAELRLEVIGAGKAEAPLAYLSVDEAAALRTRLLDLALPAAKGTQDRPPAAPDEVWAVPDAPWSVPQAQSTPEPAAERLIHRVNNRDLVFSQFLTPPVWFVPFGVMAVVAQFVLDSAWTFVGVASTFTAVIGTVVQPVRRVLDDWNFRISTDHVGLRLRHGLLETRSQTVPLNRVQAIGVTWPLLWRPKGWLRSRIDVAGYGHHHEREQSGQHGWLLPVSDEPTGRGVIGEVLPGVDLTTLPLTPPPVRARWLAPVRQPVLAAALTDRVFATRDGRLTRELVIVPYARIQSVRVVQGPLERLLGLATVHADTAGGLHAAAHHRDVSEAWTLAADLATRAHAARASRLR